MSAAAVGSRTPKRDHTGFSPIDAEPEHRADPTTVAPAVGWAGGDRAPTRAVEIKPASTSSSRRRRPSLTDGIFRRESTKSVAAPEKPRWLRRTPSTLTPKAKLGDGGITLVAAEGFYSGNSHIVAYDPSRMALFSSLIFNRELTLFAHGATWRLHFSWLVYTLFLSLLLTHIDEDQEYSTVALGLFEGAVVEFRTLTAFVLGGFILLVVGAWRERRGGYSAVCSACKALLVTIAATLPLSSMLERQHLGRWVALAFELAVLRARGQGDSRAAREYLEDTGLLVDEEWDAMEPGNRESTVFFWVNIELKNCLSEVRPCARARGRGHGVVTASPCPHPARRLAPTRWASSALSFACARPRLCLARAGYDHRL